MKSRPKEPHKGILGGPKLVRMAFDRSLNGNNNENRHHHPFP